MSKKRTIPQVALKPLSGDCSLFVWDKTTASVILSLWQVASYNSTWLYDNREYTELSPEQFADFMEKKSDILSDFETGVNMACDISLVLQDIAGKLDALEGIKSKLELIQSTQCCGGGSGGAGGSGGSGGSEIIPPEGGWTEGESSQICAAINYARDLTITYLDKYIEPLLSISLTEIGGIMLGLWITPPYSTTVLETAGVLIAALAALGAGALSPLLSDVVTGVFDEMYCRVFREGGTINGWIAEKASAIAGQYADWISSIVTWIIGASGAMDVLTNWATAIVPAGYNATCPECMHEDGMVSYTQYNPCIGWGACECGDNARIWSDACISDDPVTPEVMSLIVPAGQWYTVKIEYSAVSYYMIEGIRYELWINGALADNWQTNRENCTRDRRYTHDVPITSAVLKIRPRRDRWYSSYRINNVVWS